MRFGGVLFVFAVALSGNATAARAGELLVAAGVEGRASSWDGDAIAASSLLGGYQWRDWLGFYGLGKLGQGEVDDRVVQHFALGVQFTGRVRRVRPYARLAAVHQHESPRDAVDRTPVSTLGGWGDGIRHRAGLAASAGAYVPIADRPWGDYFAGAELSATAFSDGENGPARTWGAGVFVGVRYELGWRKRRAR